jgi:outer membrane protein
MNSRRSWWFRRLSIALVDVTVTVSYAQQLAHQVFPVQNITIQDAAGMVLAQHPLLHFQQAQVSLDEGLRLQTSGLFDTQFATSISQQWMTTPLSVYEAQSVASGTFGGTVERSSQGAMTESVARLFRTGVSVAASLHVQRILDNISSVGGNNVSTVNLALNIPLLRNRGRRVVAAQESAAIGEVRAATQDLNQEASTLLETMAVDYWNLLASQKNLDIAAASEARARKYLEDVNTLVEADQIPKNDLHELEANLAQRSATRITAEQGVVAAQEQVALDMGLDGSAVNRFAPRASDEFPSAISETTPETIAKEINDFMTLALSRRGDYLSAQQRLAEQRELSYAARNHLRPQLDLSLNAGYSGLQAGRKFLNVIDAMGTSVFGPNAGASLTFSFPPRNEIARGQLAQADALARQMELQSEQVKHEIFAEVVTALNGLVHASQAVDQTTRAVAASQASLDGQREKYRVGMGSVVDLVTIEDRLNAALSAQVQSQVSYALALSQMRYATATFVEPSSQSLSLTLYAHVFETIPDPHSFGERAGNKCGGHPCEHQ